MEKNYLKCEHCGKKLYLKEEFYNDVGGCVPKDFNIQGTRNGVYCNHCYETHFTGLEKRLMSGGFSLNFKGYMNYLATYLYARLIDYPKSRKEIQYWNFKKYWSHILSERGSLNYGVYHTVVTEDDVILPED